MIKFKHSLVTASILFSFTGCFSTATTQTDTNTNQSTGIAFEKKLDKIDKVFARSFNIQSGDNAKTIFERMQFVDGNIYVLENGTSFNSKFSVNNIESLESLEKFFLANDYVLHHANIENSKYIKISINPDISSAEKKLKETNVSINGTVPVGDVIQMLTQKAHVTPVWEDKTANNLALVNRTFNFNGNALDAINHVTNGADLSISYKEDKVLISYFKTESMFLDIFTRDRESNTDINIEMKSDDSKSNSSNTTNSSSSSNTSKDLSVKYKTLLVKELENGIEGVLSKQGSYTFLPASGQILIRDKNENVKLAQKLISDFNSKFKDTIEVTFTLYKVTKTKGDTTGLDFSALSGKFNFDAKNMVSTAFTGNTGTNMFGAGYTNGSNNAVLNFLREHGDAEIMNPVTFETQSNVLNTVKIASNYGYISSIQSTSNTTTGTTGSVTPSSVADGGFLSAIAKVIDNDTVAIDLYSTTKSLSRFNSTTAFGNTVLTPDTAEQSVDGYHRVKVGVPYILVSHKFKENKNTGAGLPIEQLDSIGLKSDNTKDVYIVMTLEAKIRK